MELNIEWINFWMYCVTALLWGIFCLRMHHAIYGGPLWKYIVGFILNFVFWPLSMVIAIVRCPIEPREDNDV